MIASMLPSIEGCWRGDLESSQGITTTVFMALREDMIVGADMSFRFTGRYTIEDGRITATISQPRHYAGPELTLWGWAGGQELELRGAVSEKSMVLRGHFLGEPLQGIMEARLTKLATTATATRLPRSSTVVFLMCER
jgi:hypothetical protein